jgi:rRNA maturation endonuclease Nob1
MSSTLGLGQFNITQRGVIYLESLEEEPFVPIQVQNNYITLRDINSPTQFQQGTKKSTQMQEIKQASEDIKELFNLVQADIKNLSINIQDEFKSEINYAVRQLEKGKDITTQLLNVGNLIKDVGINVFANLLASPIFEILKPSLDL